MAEIEKIPERGQTFATMEAPYFWEQSVDCAGFKINMEECPYRSEEMSLITFRPEACEIGEVNGCEQLVSYARIVNKDAVQQTATA